MSELQEGDCLAARGSQLYEDSAQRRRQKEKSKMKATNSVIGDHIAKSIEHALLGSSYLDPEVLKINGFATPTMRHLFSNLCHVERCSYLEVGTFCGATFVSAFNNNPVSAVGIDNFTQPFEETGVREQLRENLNRWKGTAEDVNFLDGDCFDLRPLDLQKVREHRPFDVYYYDGEHSFENQARALPAFFDVMADRFIHIVDDFQWDDVKRGTETGIQALLPRLKIEQEWHLNGQQMHDDPIWWNGVAIYLFSKLKSNEGN